MSNCVVDDLYFKLDHYFTWGYDVCDIYFWDVSSIESFDYAFCVNENENTLKCNQVRQITIHDLSEWNTSSATSMQGMFYDAKDFDSRLNIDVRVSYIDEKSFVLVIGSNLHSLTHTITTGINSYRHEQNVCICHTFRCRFAVVGYIECQNNGTNVRIS